MRMYVAGPWIDTEKEIEVLNPYDGSVVDAVPRADLIDLDRALEGAVRGAKSMARLPGYDRSRILKKAAGLMPYGGLKDSGFGKEARATRSSR